MRCIDADALKGKAWDADTRCGYVQVVDVGDIDNAPTIEPERKTGHWIYKDYGESRYDAYLCSECYHEINVDKYRMDDIGFVIEDMDFCPHCGAEMRGEQNG